MPVLTRLLTFTALGIAAVSGAYVNNIVPPAYRGKPNSVETNLNLEGEKTDVDTILSMAKVVEQKDGPKAESLPDLPVTEAVVTVVDGQLTEAGSAVASASSTTRRSFEKRARSDYNLVFSGTGTKFTDRDAYVEGTAYLTFHLINNVTYNVDACLDHCSAEPKCVFANLYYEFNNELLDREGTNLKCALFGDVHTAVEKTNRGGQQSYADGRGATYIQNSSGWAAKDLVEPDVPGGYDLVFGPINGANNAPGYMGFAFLDQYDVDACARECNNRGGDGVGGACQYFNIWRAVVNGVPTTYTCSMYFLPADASSATNTGQGNLQVTFSRGYKRQNFIVDGGFEGYNECDEFCFTESYANWKASSPPGGYLDASIFFWAEYSHSGNASALLGSATFGDNKSGTIKIAKPLKTVKGKKYQVAYFQNSAFSGPALQANSIVEVLWNGKVVQTLKPGFSQWKFHTVDVVAAGKDILEFRGGAAPAWTFLDDIAVWPMFQ